MDISEFETIFGSATNDISMATGAPIEGVYPYYDIMSRVSSLAYARAIPVTSSNGHEHLVLVAYRVVNGVEDVSVWCGDRFMEAGKLDSAEALSRAQEAAEGHPDKSALVNRMLGDFHGTCPVCSGCNFWTTWRRNRTLCRHTSTVLARLKVNSPGIVNELRNGYQAVTHSTAVSSAATAVSGFSLSSLVFRVPVLIEGDRGSGKTTEVRELVKANGYPFVEAAGHAGVEAMDLLGHLVPVGYQQMVWKDGAVSKAFRMAQKGKVILALDELLRIPDRELSVLLTALSPFDGKYSLRTGRIVEVIDGIGEEEVISCPVENLGVVATTNVGMEFQVDDIDPALAERFVVLRKDTDVASLRGILKPLVSSKGFSKGVADKLVKFFTKMTEAKKKGLVRYAPTTRTLVRAIELSNLESDVAKALEAMSLLWVARSAEGLPVDSQQDTVKKLITACLS